MPTKPEKIKIKNTRPKRPNVAHFKYGRQHQKEREVLINRHPLCQRCRAAFSEHAHSPSHHMVKHDLVMLCLKCHVEVHQEEDA